MKEVVVSDTSPVCYLILIDIVEHLPRLFMEVFVPPAVVQELAHEESPERVRTWIARPPAWLKIFAPESAPDSLGLDPGETQAIWLGKERGIRSILIDERKGTRVARDRGFRVFGTLAVIERLAEQGWIDFENTIVRLRLTNFRYSEETIEQIRKRLRATRE